MVALAAGKEAFSDYSHKYNRTEGDGNLYFWLQVILGGEDACKLHSLRAP